MSEAFKPCPFCGGTQQDFSSNGHENHMVVCECGAEGPSAINDVAAFDAWNRRAPTSAAGATNPNELTSSPEPAPALRAAEWVKRGLELADDFALKHALHVQGRATFAAVADAREAMEAHLSHASGLLPVAREGLSDETKALYDELLLAVHRKFPDESRHETALRYIRNAESAAQQSEPAAAAIRRGGDHG